MVNITKGADKTIDINFFLDGAVWSLAGLTELEVRIPASTTIRKKYTTSGVTIVSEANGQARITLSDTETDTMTVGLAQIMEIVVDKSTVKKIFQLPVLNVADELYPA